jgi:hypothetical protein
MTKRKVLMNADDVRKRLVEVINSIPGSKALTLYSKESVNQRMQVRCDWLDGAAGPHFGIFMAKLCAAIDGGGALLIRQQLAKDKAVVYGCRFEGNSPYPLDAESLERCYNMHTVTGERKGLAYGNLSDYWPEAPVASLG